MKINVGTTDRVVRALAGLVLIALAATDTVGTWGWIVGVIVLATGVIGFCGAYTLFGVNTCALPRKDASR